MKLYVLIKDGNIKTKRVDDYFPLPFTNVELERFKEEIVGEYKTIDILEDLGLAEINDNLDDFYVQQSLFMEWNNKYLDNNINGFDLPIWIECNNDYHERLKEVFNKYVAAVDTPAFRHEEGLVSEIKNICIDILNCYMEYKKNSDDAIKMMKHILEDYYNNEFLISELGKSYAFRGIAPFHKLHHDGYDKMYELMLNTPLDLYRIRSNGKEDVISNPQDMLHIPYSKCQLAREQRFSINGCPCLYLGTSSYDCWVECRKPKLETVYVSGFRPNENGEKLKILNLAFSEGLINGMYNKQLDSYCSPKHKLQNEIMKIFPLVIATSFSVNDKNENREKVEYIIPHLVMKVLKDCDIDGVAYLSKRVEVNIQYPCAVNVALPAYDICDEREYSKVCDCFDVTQPRKITVLSEEKTDSKNYLLNVFNNIYMDLSVKIYNDVYKNFAKCDNRITDLYLLSDTKK